MRFRLFSKPLKVFHPLPAQLIVQLVKGQQLIRWKILRKGDEWELHYKWMLVPFPRPALLCADIRAVPFLQVLAILIGNWNGSGSRCQFHACPLIKKLPSSSSRMIAKGNQVSLEARMVGVCCQVCFYDCFIPICKSGVNYSWEDIKHVR